MLELILLWIYMLFINVAIGCGCLKLIFRLTGVRDKKIEFMSSLIVGIVVISTGVGFFSIVGKIGLVANLILWAFALICVWCCKKELMGWIRSGKTIVFSWEGAVYFGVVLVTAFFASRGVMHTDTGIYHAQAVRWYEEYGLVKGLGNLQQHFAYNSSYLGYAAMFSLKWLLGHSLHGTNGFFMAIFCVWALRGIKDYRQHENHFVDGCRVAILVYSLVCAERIMSPATDFPSMYLVLYIITRWAELFSEKKEQKCVDDFGLLCVAVVCVTTYKLSAGMLVLLVIYPAVVWIRSKEWKKICAYLLMGIIVLCPYLIRNVLISGWLIYPFEAIDLFDVDWKVPLNLMQRDSNQIKVWGRCLFDVTKVNLPMTEWLPVWWNHKDTYEKMLIGANAVALVTECLAFVHMLFQKKKIQLEEVVLDITVLGGIVGWFLTAPFIRYGLGFLLALPLMAIGRWIGFGKMGPVKIAACAMSIVSFLFLSEYWSYYGLFEMMWTKNHLMDHAYILQQEYDVVQVEEYQMGDEIIYYPTEDENISYHAFPATAYQWMLENCQLRGDSISEGFMPIEK